jgi:hypothetical protein
VPAPEVIDYPFRLEPPYRCEMLNTAPAVLASIDVATAAEVSAGIAMKMKQNPATSMPPMAIHSKTMIT